MFAQRCYALFIIFTTIAPLLASQHPSQERAPQEDSSGVLSPESIAWVKANYNAVHRNGKKDVFVSTRGEILPRAQSIPINNIVDYIRLLTSDLVVGKMNNKEMLLRGFILFAIIQGDVFPVDYGNVATPGTNNEQLLKNAAKIAAYAMTYRRGLVEGEQDDGAIKPTAHFLGNKAFYRSKNTAMQDENDKQEYEYLRYEKKWHDEEGLYMGHYISEEIVDPSLNRQGAITQLRKNVHFPLQVSALSEAWEIMITAKDEAPTDPIYQAMYPRNIKPTTQDPIALTLPANKNIDQLIQGMGLTGQASLSPARNRTQ